MAKQTKWESETCVRSDPTQPGSTTLVVKGEGRAMTDGAGEQSQR